MADYDLITSLLLEQKNIAADNPYLNFASSLPQMQPSKDAGQNALAQTLAGFTQNFAQGYGKKQVKQEQEDLAKGVAAALTSENPQEKLKEVSPTLASAYELQIAQAKQKQQELAQKMGLDLQKYQMQQDYSHGLQRERMAEQAGYSAQLKAIPTARAEQNWDNPAAAPIVGKLARNELLTPEEARTMDTLSKGDMRLATSALGLGNTQGRFNAGEDKKEAKQAIPGYENVAGNYLTDPVINKLYDKKAGAEKIVNLLKEVKKTGDSSGFMTLVGQDAAMQEMLRGSLMNAQRVFTGSGASFTDSEQKMIASSIPAMLSADPSRAIKSMLLGRDQKQFTDAMIKFVEAEKDLEMFSYGLKNKNRPMSFYPQDLVSSYGVKGEDGATPSEQPGMIAPAAPAEEMVTVRNKTTGETMQVPRSQVGR